MKKTILATTLALALSTPAFAATNALGIDSTLNLLTFGNFTVQSADVEGRVAVGGSANINGYSIGGETRSAPGAALTVGGNLTFGDWGAGVVGNAVVGGNYASNWSGTIHGNLAIGGTLDASKGISAQSVTTWGNVTGYQSNYAPRTAGSGAFDLGFDFAAEKTRLTNLSAEIGRQDSNAKADLLGGSELHFIVSSDNANAINVFNIDASYASKNMTLDGLGNNGTVIINVHGDNVNFGSHGYTFFDSARGRVLFNLVDATTFSGGSIKASILAPKASFSGSSGAINGQVIALNWNGGVEVHNVPFAGTLPVAAVPEPESYAMLLAGLGLMAAVARRRRARD